MAVAGWLVDNSVAARWNDPRVAAGLSELWGSLRVCPVGKLEQLYSARSASDYDALKREIDDRLESVAAPSDVLDRALELQRDLANHHGLWHRISISDLLIAEIALHHGLGVLHIDRDFERIAEVRPLVHRWMA